ncbi:tripartite tricarboxylate transporter TctB family protein [Psychromarinibacter sp. C21-152]|uniref:Tripartite tricarboxylate transporter TctB family protein n=1 Tax=Psychromarinibacter sediminicola TaxID=3033385 RepID=A0AAE3NW34_9RHOB|nr:tripartite tricarboxylate transporter TctB family protein [Psychromarinibacter sediminicola]MDF0601712.1 tripartite tricarboxylate transporter TctB family protein [Psychromarinibacter sediminicola]
MSDRIFGGIGLILAIFFAWQASVIQESFLSDAVGPKVFPYVIAAVMTLASLYFLLKPDPEPSWPRMGHLAEIGLAAAVMFAYAQVLPELGFVISTAVAAAYLTWRLGSPPLQSVIIGVSTSVGIYVIFRLLLGLSLARGPFGF